MQVFIEQFLRDVQLCKIREKLLTKKEFKKDIMTTKNFQVRYLEGKYYLKKAQLLFSILPFYFLLFFQYKIPEEIAIIPRIVRKLLSRLIFSPIKLR